MVTGVLFRRYLRVAYKQGVGMPAEYPHQRRPAASIPQILSPG